MLCHYSTLYEVASDESRSSISNIFFSTDEVNKRLALKVLYASTVLEELSRLQREKLAC